MSRRRFVGGLAATLGYVGSRADLWAQGGPAAVAAQRARGRMSAADYDAMVKLGNNENNWGPPQSVMTAMNNAWKYVGRYGYPDANIVQVIAEHDGVKPENILLGAGSGEILDVVGTTFLQGGRKVIGVDPSYGSVYQHATLVKADAIKLPLTADYRQDMDALIEATNRNARDLGFVYLCNPNNPTGVVVSAREVRQLLDHIPRDMPVLIDEAYHHYVDDPAYATSIPYVKEGRPVIVARTFSKIVGLAAMRLGYAIAPREIVQRMRPYAMGSINVLVKHGGAAALNDPAAQEKVKRLTLQNRKSTAAALAAHGYDVIPSETNFFMVGIGREVQPVIAEFRAKGILVGRPFPPMTQHLRVSVGTEDDMQKFLTAFKEIFPARTSTAARG
ncbi:MAG: histidinol-phosphate transaminase [Vicinamibacterales bacterium]